MLQTIVGHKKVMEEFALPVEVKNTRCCIHEESRIFHKPKTKINIKDVTTVR